MGPTSERSRWTWRSVRRSWPGGADSIRSACSTLPAASSSDPPDVARGAARATEFARRSPRPHSPRRRTPRRAPKGPSPHEPPLQLQLRQKAFRGFQDLYLDLGVRVVEATLDNRYRLVCRGLLEGVDDRELQGLVVCGGEAPTEFRGRQAVQIIDLIDPLALVRPGDVLRGRLLDLRLKRRADGGRLPDHGLRRFMNGFWSDVVEPGLARLEQLDVLPDLGQSGPLGLRASALEARFQLGHHRQD